MLDRLGGRIRARREKLGLKQVDIANALQVSSQAVSKWERGENAPDITLLPSLAKLLDVSTDFLLGTNISDKDVFPATVFVSSLKGYAIKSQQIGPKELSAWLNGFLYRLTESVIAHEGVPVKQTGDGLLCFFSGHENADRAVDCALEIVRSAEERVAVSLATGDIYLGSIGHPDYARPDIAGDTVNTAFSLMEIAESYDTARIVANESCVNQLQKKYEIKGPEKRELTYFPDPVNVYQFQL